jgi:predicted DNA-binding WGR domain protein
MQSQRYFELQDNKSAKFWEITTDGTAVTVRYGKIGTNGQSQTKELADAAAAAKHVAKLVAEKTGKGYVESGDSAVAQVASEPVPEATPAAPRKKAAPAKKTAVTNPAKDPEASPESLLALLDKDDTTNRLLARHPRAGADLLEKLSHSSDKATRQAVTANPATPPDVYLRLGQQFPKEFLANPMLDLLLLERPALLHEQPDTLLVQILRHATCPDDFLIWAARHESEKVQLAVAMNPKAPEQAKDKLRQSHYPKVRESLPNIEAEITPEVAEAMFREEVRKKLEGLSVSEAKEAWSQKDIGLPQWTTLCVASRLAVTGVNYLEIEIILFESTELITYFSNSPVEELRHLVAASFSTPLTVLAKLAMDTSIRVRRAATWNKKVPTEVLRNLINDPDEDVRCNIANNPNTPIEIIHSLSLDSSDRVRSQVALNSSTAASILADLSHDECVNVRTCVADNSSTPIELLFLLSDDMNCEVRRAVASNPSSTEDVLKNLSNDTDEWVRRWLAGNPNTPPEVLIKLAGDADEDIRRDVATNTKTPQSALLKLAKDKDELVKCGVAENPSTPIKALQALSKDKDDFVREYIFKNTGISPEILETLALESKRFLETYVEKEEIYSNKILDELEKIGSFSFKTKLASYANSAIEILEKLSNDTTEWVRVEVAKNKVTPHLILDKLGVDNSFWVREAVACNTNAPAELLRKLALDKSDRVRIRVASNYSTPPDVVLLLASDEAKEVRSIASRNEELPPEVLHKLSKDKSIEVRASVAKNPATPHDALMELSNDKSSEVRDSVASNQKCPPNILEHLAKSKASTWVKTSLACNQQSPHNVLLILSDDKNEEIRKTVASHPNPGPEVIARLSNDPSTSVRLALLKNPALSSETRNRMILSLMEVDLESDPWFNNELRMATDPVKHAVLNNDILHFSGKDTGKTFRSTRPVAKLMALCSEGFIEPSDIAKSSSSTDWLIRAGIARNQGAPGNIVKKLISDANPVVASLAKSNSAKIHAV